MRDLMHKRRKPRINYSHVVTNMPFAARWILRGGPEAQSAAVDALGIVLSQIACRAISTPDVAALWLGPDEQLILAPEASGAELNVRLARALRTVPHSLVDVSHRQAALLVTGPYARAVLNAGCPLDLDLAAFPVDACTRTLFGKAEIVLWRKDHNGFYLEAERSFASYVSGLLAEAAHEQ
jgi:sarcosine oxidase subunit gamma